jgi:hypothetical protein
MSAYVGTRKHTPAYVHAENHSLEKEEDKASKFAKSIKVCTNCQALEFRLAFICRGVYWGDLVCDTVSQSVR